MPVGTSTPSRPTRLMLLPGMDGTGTLFRWLIDALPKHYDCESVAYDRARSATYDELVDMVRMRLVSREAPTVMVAESFSGAIAIRLAADPPPQLRGVVLAASFSRSPVPGWLAGAVGSWLFAVPPPVWLVRRYLVGFDAPTDVIEETLAAMGSVSARVMANRLRQVIALDVTDELRRAKVPVRYVFAKHDHLVNASIAYPGVELSNATELPGPHTVLQRCPIESARVIDDFATSVSEFRSSRIAR